MGMFDSVSCKYPLPMPENPQGYTGSVDFQTKCLDNVMDNFEIREDGTLWKSNVIYETTDTEWVPFFRDHITPGRGKCTYKIKDVQWVPHNITQTIEIYNYINSDIKGVDCSITYQIMIIDGKVQKVDLTQFEASDNSYRLELQKIHIERMMQRCVFESTLLYRILFKPYNKIINFVFKHLCRVNRYWYNNLWKLERKLTI